MDEIRFLLDENVNPLLRSELLKRNPSIIVWKIGDPAAPGRGTPDPEILSWCEKNSFILVTNNRKSMPLHVKNHLSKGQTLPGILELKPDMSLGETVDELLLIHGAVRAEELKNLILYLPVS